ncbi:MAG: cell division protein FtsL [Treponema sp.]|jgi:cell division protein FtsL|nr:cell division protein FtsL [Treponema sp.]
MTKLKIKDFFKVIALCIFAASIPALLALYAVQAKKYTDLTKEVAELEVKQEKLIEENKKLVSDISQLSSAERIERIAVEELGMHKTEAEDIIRVEMTGEKK